MMISAFPGFKFDSKNTYHLNNQKRLMGVVELRMSPPHQDYKRRPSRYFKWHSY